MTSKGCSMTSKDWLAEIYAILAKMGVTKKCSCGQSAGHAGWLDCLKREVDL